MLFLRLERLRVLCFEWFKEDSNRGNLRLEIRKIREEGRQPLSWLVALSEAIPSILANIPALPRARAQHDLSGQLLFRNT
jgi:hypothetical protein